MKLINRINIIQRIKELDKEVGLTVESENSSSLKDIIHQILNKLISTSTGDINGKIIDLYDKMNNVYNDLASTSTSYTKGKIADLYYKFNNIYNELNSTSTSYMKGKINSIYSKSNESKELNIIHPLSLLGNNDLFFYLTKRITFGELAGDDGYISSTDYYNMFLTQDELNKLKTFNNIDFQMDPTDIYYRGVDYITYFNIAYRLYTNDYYNIRIGVKIVDNDYLYLSSDNAEQGITLRIYAFK